MFSYYFSSFVDCILYLFVVFIYLFFFFKQKTAYEMRISDWSSDVCSSDLIANVDFLRHAADVDGPAGQVVDANAQSLPHDPRPVDVRYIPLRIVDIHGLTRPICDQTHGHAAIDTR